MPRIIAVCVVSLLAACSDEAAEDPRDRKAPLPKTAVAAAVVQVEPFNANAQMPLVMHAVLRCRLDGDGHARCELQVPRSRARMV